LTAAKAKPEPTGRAVYLAESGGLVFQANDLGQLAQDKAYELWVIPANGQAPIPAGVFRPDAAGSASVLMPPLPKGVPAKAFGVTIEKAEGSATPTTPIILVGAVASTGE
jgi:anti-sigma-K factor RskA